MIKINNKITSLLLASIMMLGTGSASAALVNFEIEGTVLVGEETFTNSFGLYAGDTILATGVFDDGVLAVGSHYVSFGFGGVNTLAIDVNGTVYTHEDDLELSASLSFEDGVLVNFDFYSADFNSLFTQFDDYGFMLGEWGQVTTSPVPVPAAFWLFGSGLIALVGFVRRKK